MANLGPDLASDTNKTEQEIIKLPLWVDSAGKAQHVYISILPADGGHVVGCGPPLHDIQLQWRRYSDCHQGLSCGKLPGGTECFYCIYHSYTILYVLGCIDYLLL